MHDRAEFISVSYMLFHLLSEEGDFAMLKKTSPFVTLFSKEREGG